MTTRIRSEPGLFGDTVYRDDDGNVIATSNDDIFGGTSYYSRDNRRIGYDVETAFGSTLHHSDDGTYLGFSTDEYNHFNKDGSLAALSNDDLFGSETVFLESDD